MPTNRLDTLPPELLFVIRSHIPLDDLRTLACFAMADPRTSSHDADAEDEFWMRSCRLAGLSCIHDDLNEDGHPSWKKIAFETITQDGFCELPECGVRRLQANGTCSVPWRRRLCRC